MQQFLEDKNGVLIDQLKQHFLQQIKSFWKYLTSISGEITTCYFINTITSLIIYVKNIPTIRAAWVAGRAAQAAPMRQSQRDCLKSVLILPGHADINSVASIAALLLD